jgi:protein SCO1/2
MKRAIHSLALALAAVLQAPSGAHDVAGGEHADHHHAMAHQVTRSVSSYAVPAIPLVREDGAKVVLSEELSGERRPVVLNFIYTTCTSICPLSSQTFAQLQSLLGSARDRVRLVSLSIDPEQDTPARLAEYGRKYGAGPEWHYYTGTTQASLAAQRAFAVYKGDKMSHTPVTLVRTAPGAQWVRFDGFATAADLMNELRATIASN